MLVLGLTRWRSFGVVAALALAGCTHDRSELYAPPVARDVGTEPPILPALPDVDKRAACEACAKDKCATSRDNCLEDDDCVAQLRCKGKCSDPACLEACDVAHAFSIWYRDYQFCVLGLGDRGGQCIVECGVGENWGCLGQYAFREASNKAYELELRFVGPSDPDDPNRLFAFPPLAGASVRACGDAALTDCGIPDNSQVLAGATIGAYNSATLELRGLYHRPMQITGGGASELAELYDRPCTGPQQREVTFLSRVAVNQLRPGAGSGDVGFPLDGPDRTNVLVEQGDCLAAGAPGVRFALFGEPDPDRAYVDLSAGSGGLDRTDSSGFGVLGVGLGGRPSRTLVLEGHRADGGEVLSRRSVEVALAWSTSVYLLPLERGEH